MGIEYLDKRKFHKEQYTDREDALAAGGFVRKDERILTNTILELTMGSKVTKITETDHVVGTFGSVEPSDSVTLLDALTAGLDVTKAPTDTATSSMTGILTVGFGYGGFGELGFGGANAI